MLTLRYWLLALALSLAPLSFASSAHACKCAPQAAVDAFNQADAVFEGRVVTIKDAQSAPDARNLRQVTLSIVRVWKDLEDVETVTVTTAPSSASCGFPFEENQSYLVYAKRTEQALTVHSCSRTRPMAEASEDLAHLGGGVTPVRITSPAPAQKPATDGTKTPPKAGGCSVVGPAHERRGEVAGFLLALTVLALTWGRTRSRLSALTRS